MTRILKNSGPHLHIFEKSATRNKDWRKQIFRCVDPDCHHYNRAELILGKRARCFNCKSEIIVEQTQIKNATLVGLCCSKSKRAQNFRAAQVGIERVIESVMEPLIESPNFTVQHQNVPEMSFGNPFGEDNGD